MRSGEYLGKEEMMGDTCRKCGNTWDNGGDCQVCELAGNGPVVIESVQLEDGTYAVAVRPEDVPIHTIDTGSWFGEGFVSHEPGEK